LRQGGFPGGGNHTFYTPGTSAQLQTGQTWKISYHDGTYASGIVYSDLVTIGGTTVTGQIVEAANNASSNYGGDEEDDGLVGLGFNNINQGKHTTSQ
jgi:aspergillopepsin I